MGCMSLIVKEDTSDSYLLGFHMEQRLVEV